MAEERASHRIGMMLMLCEYGDTDGVGIVSNIYFVALPDARISSNFQLLYFLTLHISRSQDHVAIIS